MSKSISERKRGIGSPLLSQWLPLSWMDDLFDERISPMMRTGFDAQLDLAENENEFEVKVDLPGVAPGDVEIRIDKSTLTITGERVDQKESEKDNEFHRIERVSGKFARTIVLPGPVDEENATAEFESGVLKVKIPKCEASKARRIDIK